MIKAENRNVIAEVKAEATTNKVANKKIIKRNDKAIEKALDARIKDVCKASDIKTHKLDVSKYDALHTQASLIDAMIRNKEKLTDIINKVAVQFYSTDSKKAETRVLRHFKHDASSRIVKRNALLNSL
jgi:hypothetical protein